MKAGISPIIATTLLIAIAVIASVTVWFWSSAYVAKPALAETAAKSFAIVNAYKNASNDGCYSVDIKNAGGSAINNAIFEARDYQTGEPAGMGGMWLSDSGLVSYWNFDEAVGNVSKDFVARGNNGTYNGEFTNDGTFINGVNRVAGAYGNAIQLDGNNDYVSMTNMNGLFNISNGTVLAWIRTPNAGSSFRGIAVKQAAYGMFLLDNSFAVYDWGATAVRNTNVNLADGSWHHVGFTFQSSLENGTRLYIDGTLNLTVNYTITNQNTNLSLGANSNPGGSQFFNGTIDSVRTWDRVLNQTEIQAEMGSPMPVLKPIASWEFDESAGTVANDTHAWTKGKFGTSLGFDSVNDYVIIPAESELNVNGTHTLSVWLKRVGYSGTGFVSTIVNRGAQTPSAGYYWTYINSGNSALVFQYANGTAATSIIWSYSFNTSWYHIAFVRNGETVNAYVNGEDIGSRSAPAIMDVGLQTTFIGEYQGNAHKFNGSIDDVAIFNRSLTSTEIAGLYDSGLALSDTSRTSYLNISSELSPGSTQNYNFSYPGNSSARISLPRGSYILRSSTPGYADQRFTCA